MKYAPGKHPGAIWKKSDFQIHTPRDRNWSGGPHLPGGTPAADKLRHEWAKDFIAKCLDLGITAIAITDHHDFCFIPYVQKAASEIQDDNTRPWVFPGVEITCNDGVQCLLLMDQETNLADCEAMFHGILKTVGSAPSIEKLGPNIGADGCGREIQEVIREIRSTPQFNSCSIIIPHGGQKGHKTILRTGMHNRFAELDMQGVYCEHRFEEFGKGELKILKGEVAEWGSRRLGVLTTGDNRYSDFRRLGINPCWIRLGEPTTESIRQALLADEARISHLEPSVPNYRITGLKVDSTLTGGDFELVINDGFNTIIGGRGSGKTAVLAYLRFALGRSASDLGLVDQVSTREANIVEDTLGDEGYVSVTLVRNGVHESWQRDLANKDLINVVTETGGPEQIPIKEARERFPARCYQQKEISTLGEADQQQDQRITKIAAAEFEEAHKFANQHIDASKREVRSVFQRLVYFWRVQAEHDKAKRGLADLRRQLVQINGLIDNAGISEEDRKILDEAATWAKADSIIEESEQQVDDFAADLEKVQTKSELFKANIFDEFSKYGWAQELTAAFKSVGEVLTENFESISSSLDQFEKTRKQCFKKFKEEKNQYVKIYKGAKGRAKNHSALLQRREGINVNIAKLEKEIRIKISELEAQEGTEEELKESRNVLNTKIEELNTLLEEAANDVHKISGEMLRASVKSEEFPTEIEAMLLCLIRGSGIHDAETKCRNFAKKLADPERLHLFQDDLIYVRSRLLASGEEAKPGESITKKIQEMFEIDFITTNAIARIYRNITDENVKVALVAKVGKFIGFEYYDSGDFISFEKASPGQQAAAILELLLGQDAGTLIIDQPEDDLDNRRIMTIAGMLRQSKSNRQIIFATHNANLVVNGDADKTIVLKSVPEEAQDVSTAARIVIETDGAIETQSVRDAITLTLEGGEEAFELRGRKYKIKKGKH